MALHSATRPARQPGPCVPALAAVMAMASAAVASAETAASAEEAIRAMQQGRCESAVEAANKGLVDGEPKAYFLVGMMRLRGLCIVAAPEKAAAYFEPAAKAGHVDSAYMLAMMHGTGLGVPQSYAQAGRWTIAMLDLAGQKRAAASSPAGPIDVRDATAYGVLGTVAALVRDRTMYPKQGARLAATSVSATLTLKLGPEGLRYELRDPRSALQDDGGSSILRRSNQPYVEAMEEIIDGAIRELPAFETPRVPYEISVTYSFNLRYR